MDTAQMLIDFSHHCGIPGVEDGINYAKSLLDPYGKVSISPLGSVVCTIREPKAKEPHILLDAHLDEIGLMVSYIEDNGFLRVGQFGGIDARLLAASRVTIHTKTGDINGVICSVPPHLGGGEDKNAQSADKVFIDTGLDTKTAKEKIALGDRVSFHTASKIMLNDNVTGKAMDDHAGCVSLIKALDYLGKYVPCGLTVMFSTMEEVGGMGAKTSAYSVDPTHALVVDVSFGNTPATPKHKSSELTGGPMIGFSPILNHQLSQQLIKLAADNNIPYNAEVMGGTTGTNSDSIVTSRGGVPTALISIPLRYMHMPIEVVNVEDVENTGKLIACWINDLAKVEAK